MLGAHQVALGGDFASAQFSDQGGYLKLSQNGIIEIHGSLLDGCRRMKRAGKGLNEECMANNKGNDGSHLLVYIKFMNQPLFEMTF